MLRFDDKVIVVTGGSLGIGEACCRAFAERGGRVVVASRGAAAADKLVAALGGSGYAAIHVSADVMPAYT
jgi:NAD(P)-dependent dehydrogenase (short-subunit alcohol dehydrogenase family)